MKKLLLSLFALGIYTISFAQYENILISNTSGPNEPSICMDPNNPMNIVAAANTDKYFISSDGGRKKNVVGGSDTQKIVNVHDQRILCNAFPYGKVSCFLPVHIGQRRFCSCSVSMHHQAIGIVSCQMIGYNFTKCLREQALVYIFNRIVNVFFGSRNPTLTISFTDF